MRVINTFKNALVGTSMQLLSMGFSFLTRAVFVRVLTVEYLGVESVLVDLIGMLSIAELGFSTAIMYSLYGPLRNRDYTALNSIMKLYKKVYETIGIVIFLLGLLFTPFLKKFINQIPTVEENIYIIFILFLINSVISYFFSYKQTLITATQKDYIVQRTTKTITILSNIVQIITLILFRDFIVYLIIKIMTTILINVILSIKANDLFPFLNLKSAENLNKEELVPIKKNIGAMFLHKVGYRIVFSTDNIFISIYSTIANAGKYSNYHLVTNSLALLIDNVLNASIASVGDLNTEGNLRKSEEVFEHLFFLNFILYSLSSSILFSVFNDFIQLWLGDSYQLSVLSVALIIINFYIHGMRRAVIIFRDSWGLFYRDRYKPILEIVTNIILQIILGTLFGLNGIILGTSLTIIFTSFWIEPYVLYKFGFKSNVRFYFYRYIRFLIIFIVFCTINFVITDFIVVTNILHLAIKTISSIAITSLTMYLLLKKDPSYNYYKNMILNLLKNRSS